MLLVSVHRCKCGREIQISGPGRPPKRCGLSDPAPESERGQTTTQALADAVRELAPALHSGDEPAIRSQARHLSREAAILASSYPLQVGLLARRQRVAVERTPSGRGAC